jgi:hypothetical protein
MKVEKQGGGLMSNSTRTFLFLAALAASSLLLTGCFKISSPYQDETPAQPRVYESLQLEITPDFEMSEPVAVKQGGFIHITAEGFPPDAPLRVFLGSPGTEYKDPAATGKFDSEGKTSAIFSIPRKWDDGQPLTQEELLIIVESGEGGESVTFMIGYWIPEEQE